MAAYEREKYACCAASSDLLKITQYRRCHSVHARSKRHKSAIADRAFHPHTQPRPLFCVCDSLVDLVTDLELTGLVRTGFRHSLSRRLIRRRQLPFKICYPSQRFVSLCLRVVARLLFLLQLPSAFL